MKKFFKLQKFIFAAVLSATAFVAPVAAASSIGDRINEIVTEFPWVGLIAKKVTYGPVTISKLNIEDSGRLVFCKKGEEIEGTLRYSIDADKLDTLHLHHIIVGLRGEDAQTCISHSFGVWDKSGKSSFSLQVPEAPGVYEVCFDYHHAPLCSEAQDKWNDDVPSHKTTIGIVVVE